MNARVNRARLSRRAFPRIILAAMGLLLFSLSARAMDYPFHQFSRQYTELDGLPNSKVYSIAQDSHGVLWFATRGAIASYDGEAWTRFSYPDRLPRTEYRMLQADSSGGIWAATRFGGIGRYTDAGWTSVTDGPPLKGRYNIATSFLVPVRGEGDPLLLGTSLDGLWAYRGGEWKRITTGDGEEISSVSGMARWRGGVLLATGRGLWWLDPDSMRLVRPELEAPDGEIAGIAVESLGADSSRIWLAGRDWAGKIEGGSYRRIARFKPLTGASQFPHLTLLPDRHGNLFLGNPVTLFHLHADGYFHPFGSANGLAANGAYSMLLDREVNFWFCSDRGATKIPSFRFQNLGIEEGLLQDEVTAICEVEPDRLLFGHNTGLTVVAGTRKQIVRFSSGKGVDESRTRVMDIEAGRGGSAWIAAHFKGLARLDRDGGLSWIPFADGATRDVLCLETDPSGRLLVGTGDGFFRLRNGVLVRDTNLPVCYVRNMLFTADGALYFAWGRDGAGKWAEGRLTRFYARDHKEGYIYTFLENGGDPPLAGTIAGLMTLAGDSLRTSPLGGEPIDRPVYLLVRDAKERLWIGTDNGVYRWDGETLRHFTQLSGLAGMETNRAAGLLDSRGRLWIGTSSGVSRYAEKYDDKERMAAPPHVDILAVHAAGKTFPPDKPVSFQAGTMLNIQYRCASFLEEGQVQYLCRLENERKKTSSEFITDSRQAHYANLPPGRYRFTVQATDGLGHRSEPVSTAFMTIRGPFYTRAWFILLAFTLLGGSAFLLARYFAMRRISEVMRREIERKTAQLTATEAKYSNLVRGAVFGIFRVDMDGGFLDVNPALVTMLGFDSADDLMRRNLFTDIFADPAEGEKVRGELTSAELLQGREAVWRKRNGELVQVRLSGRISRDRANGEPTCEIIVDDITEAKRLTEAVLEAQKLESLGLLAGGIAHDFNNALGAIVGNVDLAKMDIPETHPAYRNLKNIQQVALRAAERTQQLLAYSGQGTYIVEAIHLSRLIQQMEDLIRISVPEPIRLETHLEEDLPTFEADRSQMQQVVLNLLRNAVEAIGGNSGEIHLRTGRTTADPDHLQDAVPAETNPGEFVYLEVEDSGCGMDEESRGKMFDPFFTTKFPGRGLGLSAVLGIMRSLEGAIQVSTHPGKGTTVRLLFRVGENPAPPGGEPGQTPS